MVLNHITLAGNLTAVPELKQTPSGVSVVRFKLAVDDRITPKGREKNTDFFACVAWHQNAEFLSRYADKGDTVVIEGRIKSEKWTDKQGNNRETVSVVADSLQICSHKRSGSATAGEKEKTEYVPTPYQQNATEGFVEVEGDADLPF